MCIFAKSERAAKRIQDNVTRFIEKKLLLKVNQEKTKICEVGLEVQFLGFSLKRVYKNFKKGIVPERGSGSHPYLRRNLTYLNKRSRRYSIEKRREVC